MVCSIYGVIQTSGKPIPSSTKDNIESALSWWNPTQLINSADENCLIGQVSASNTDIPVDVNNGKELAIVMDARIDNHDALCKELKLLQDTSDSSLIASLYSTYGASFCEKLIGAFTIAIWDKSEKRIIVVRDQMGIKPLNYYFKDGLFAFGTEKKSILSMSDIDKTPDWVFILNSMSNLGTETDATEYKQIKQLPPGHFLILENGSINIQKYWELDVSKETVYKDEKEYEDEFLSIFKEAIRCRFDKESATACHLSGGLDSSGITSVSHEIANELNSELQILSYNIIDNVNIDPAKFDENLKAFNLIKYLNADKLFTNVNTPIKRSIHTMTAHETICCDGISKTNNVNTEYEIQAKANESNCKVLLSGFGGDELVTSFCRPFYLEHFDNLHLIKYFFDKRKSRHTSTDRSKALVFASLSKIAPILQSSIATFYAKNRYKNANFKGTSPFINKEHFTSANLDSLINTPKYFPMNHVKFPHSLRQYQRNHVCRQHTNRRIESEILAGKYWNIEYRYPMADIRLLQYVLSLPLEQKISKDMSRRIFRKSMTNYLPDSIRLRDYKRAGSLKPLASIKYPAVKKELFDFIQNVESSKKAEFLNFKYIKQWIKSKNNVFALYQWMILAQLGFDDKLDYNKF